ncbi:hypothetical protein [Streptomyces scopuliridis]|uniref:hypothetical protein n=1 Tax=Streptomyces scopuliridis TaxID=452529 RepID=UPI003699565D
MNDLERAEADVFVSTSLGTSAPAFRGTMTYEVDLAPPVRQGSSGQGQDRLCIASCDVIE